FVEDLQLYFERVKAMQPGKKHFLLGHSMGALISLAFTERHQDEIDALVISGAPILADANVSPALVWVGNVMTKVAPRLPFVKVNQPGILSSDPEIDKAWESDPLTYKGLMRVRLGVELNNMARAVRERLSELHQPILILHGAQDRLVNPSGSQFAYDHVASSDKTLRLYPNMRHEIMNEIGKEAVLDEIVAWLDRHR
ncbi:MAG TPA: alpha/beta fold hydrolase, partial [Phototrophicaceae bacterium]|nr:alpha/beta fold hydrolase [Phototrophicaceae bacterium]